MDGFKKRILIRLSVVGLGLFPVLSFALGLADIQVDSRLNQPLRGRIEILDVTNEEWRQVHARLHQEFSLEHDVLHSEILGSVTLRPVEDASHRHFIEVRSTEPITEPLFDLPVEVADSNGRVVRSFSILLDPPGADTDTPRSVADTTDTRLASAPEVKPTSPPLIGLARTSEIPTSQATLDDERPPIRTRQRGHRPAHAARTQQSNPAAAVAAAPAKAASPAPAKTAVSAEQEELRQQLDSLQQMLAKMQETISAQNAQIGSLANKVASSIQPRAAPPAPPAVEPTNSDDDEAVEATKPGMYVLLAGLGLTTILALVFAAVMWVKTRRVARREVPGRHTPDHGSTVLQAPTPEAESVLFGPRPVAPKPVPSQPAAPLWKPIPGAATAAPSRQPEVQRPSWKPAPLDVKPLFSRPTVGDTQPHPARPDLFEKTVMLEPLPVASKDDGWDTAKLESVLANAAPQRDTSDTVIDRRPPIRPNQALAETENLPQEYLEELPAAYIARMPSAQDLEAAVADPAATAVLPDPAATTDPAATLLSTAVPGSATSIEARALLAEESRSLVNKEVAEILEKSLGNDPHRVDIRLKLLEIYHHEVQGNRAEFNSLLSKLIADPRMLTPAQRAHVEKLQRSLSDDKPETGPDFVAKVAI